MAMAGEPKKLRWDGTVTAGNVLSALAMAFTVLIWGVRLEGRVDHHNDRIAELEAAKRNSDQVVGAARERLAGIEANIAAQTGALNRVADKIDRMAGGGLR